MKVRVELYGRLSEAGLGKSVELKLRGKPKSRELLEALAARLGPQARLLQGAALATERELLGASDPIPSRGRLAVLPPVCGG